MDGEVRGERTGILDAYMHVRAKATGVRRSVAERFSLVTDEYV